MRPGSRAPETPPDDDTRDAYWAPPRVFATEGQTAYFRLAARNFGEETCVERPADVSTGTVPSVACVSEPLGAVILNAPAEGSAEEAEKGSLRAVVFPDDLAELDAAFGDGGFAARVVSGFDKDRFVLANGSGFSVSEVGNTLSGNTYPSSVTGSNAFAGYERVEVDDDGIALRGIVAEALRLGVASVASLAEVDNSSAAAFPVAWTSSLGLGPTGYDPATARIVPFSARLILAYTPPAIAAGFPFATFAYGITDAAGARSANTSVARVFFQHALDLAASRITRFPHWALRPISPSVWVGTRAEDTADWWAIRNGSASSPGAVGQTFDQTRLTNFLVPKRLGEMGAFAYPFGRNDIGQLGMGSARPRRFPTLADDVRHRGLDLDRLAVGSRSTIGISNADGKAYAWGDGSGGRLGTGDAFPRTSPTAIGALGDAVVARVAAHAAHAAAVTERATCGAGAPTRRAAGPAPAHGAPARPAAVSVDPVAAAAAEPRAPRRSPPAVWTACSSRRRRRGRAHGGSGLERHAVDVREQLRGAAREARVSDSEPGGRGRGMRDLGRARVRRARDAGRGRPGHEAARRAAGRGNRRDASAGRRLENRGQVSVRRRRRGVHRGHLGRAPPGSEAEATLASRAARAREPGGVPSTERPPDPRFPPNATVMGQAAFDEVAGAIGGRVYTFGWGDVGQLGHGTGFTPDMPDAYRASVPTPVAALEGVDVVQVSAGRRTSRRWTAPGACTPGAPGRTGSSATATGGPRSRRASCARCWA